MKYKGIEVKEKPFVWRVLPWLYRYMAQALYPNIYVTPEVFGNLQSEDPNPRYIAVLEHEKKHIERQKRVGKNLGRSQVILCLIYCNFLF